jgi:hypothetical protein
MHWWSTRAPAPREAPARPGSGRRRRGRAEREGVYARRGSNPAAARCGSQGRSLGRRGSRDIERDLRVLAREGRQARRELARAEAQGRREPQAAVRGLRDVLHVEVEDLVLVEQRADAVEMGLPASVAVAARVVRFSNRPPSSDPSRATSFEASPELVSSRAAAAKRPVSSTATGAPSRGPDLAMRPTAPPLRPDRPSGAAAASSAAGSGRPAGASRSGAIRPGGRGWSRR